MKNSWAMVISIGIYCGPVRGQEDFDFEQLIERNFGFQEEAELYEHLYQQLYDYYLHPLDLNKANREELRALTLLSEQQIASLIQYRTNNGPFYNILEMQGIPGFNPEVIRSIRPFLKVTRRPAPGTLQQRVSNAPTKYALIRYGRALQKKSGYLSRTGVGKPFQGSMDHVFAKLRLSKPGDFSVGMTLEKDAGESLRWDNKRNKYYFDFQSFHIMVENRSRIRKLLIGDFQIQTGQGLMNGGGFQLGKGTEPISAVRRSNLGVLPYGSANESGFYRGVAVEIDLQPIQVLSFYSRQKRDAWLTYLSGHGQFSSLRSTGLHRTLNEVASRKTLKESVLGQRIQYHSQDKSLLVGMQASYLWYDFRKVASTQPYQKYDLVNQSLWNLGSFITYQWQNFNLFGEFVESGGAKGALAGVVGSLGNRLDVSIHLRNYAPGFQTANGSAFGENSRNQNESGIYWGIKIHPFRGIVVKAYYDRFKFRWLKFGVDAPSEGYETLISTDINPGEKTQVQVSWRHQQKDQNSTAPGAKLNHAEPGKKRNLVLQLTHLVSSAITLKTRVQRSWFEFGNLRTAGFLLSQDLNLDFGKLRLSTRVALFDADDFDNRQYVFERHVLYRVSFPFFKGVGIRNYAMVQIKMHSRMVLWIRYARTEFRHQETIGSGLDQIDGNSQSDVTAQLIWKF